MEQQQPPASSTEANGNETPAPASVTAAADDAIKQEPPKEDKPTITFAPPKEKETPKPVVDKPKAPAAAEKKGDEKEGAKSKSVNIVCIHRD
jgi:hypothetical protein